MSAFLFFPLLGLSDSPKEKEKGKKSNTEELIRTAVDHLIKEQEENGRWTYEALHRDEEEEEGLPLGFRVGGTSITATAVMFAAPDNKEAQAAVQKALGWVLKELENPKMVPLLQDAYDVRIWGHTFALEFLCRARARKLTGQYEKEVNHWITRLVEIIIEEEFEGGGWNYAGGRSTGGQASFVTAPATQSLLLARSQGEKVPDEILERCREVLESDRMKDGAFTYGGKGDSEDSKEDGIDALPGSAGRSPLCETTLILLGGGSLDAVRAALENINTNREHLEERRAQPGTHEGTYAIAPYFYLYGHRFAAQAIMLLPEKEREKQLQRLIEPIISVRNENGSWSDRSEDLPRARFVGTSFSLYVLLGDKAPPLPPKWTKTAKASKTPKN